MGLTTPLTPSVGVTESEAALALVARQRRKRLRPKSIGADKGYHNSRFVDGLRAQRIAPHVAHYGTGPGWSTIESPGYHASQIVRKRIEQFFGWARPSAVCAKLGCGVSSEINN